MAERWSGGYGNNGRRGGFKRGGGGRGYKREGGWGNRWHGDDSEDVRRQAFNDANDDRQSNPVDMRNSSQREHSRYEELRTGQYHGGGLSSRDRGNTDSGGGGSRPRGLRGRDIGLFYARRSRQSHGKPHNQGPTQSGPADDNNFQDPRGGHRGGGAGRCPPGLKGKEIGLWYARKNREMGGNKDERRAAKLARQEAENRMFIRLDEDKERRLIDLLTSLRPSSQSRFSEKEDCDAVTTITGSSGTRSVSQWDNSSSSRTVLPSQPDWNQSQATGISKLSNYCDFYEKDSGQQLVKGQEHWFFDYSNSGPQSSSKPAAGDVVGDPMFIDISSEESDENYDEDSVATSQLKADQKQFNTGVYFDDDDGDDEKEVENGDGIDISNVIILSDDEIDEHEEDGDDGYSFMDEFKAHIGSGPSYCQIAEKSANDRPGLILVKDTVLDTTLQSELAEKLKSSPYCSMLAKRQHLPSYQLKKEVVNTIHDNQVVVISGETGCGKTTQVPQFILDDMIERGQGSTCRIVCTQPRRISAISVAERVADERCEKIGRSVGYQIRLDHLLSTTSHVVLDEVHERETLTDFLMIILRDLTRKRTDLKLILMSATLNAHQFSSYFSNSPMLHIPGFTFPVEHLYLEDIIETVRYKPDTRVKRRPNWSHLRKDKEELQRLEDEYRIWANNLRGYSRSTVNVLREIPYDNDEIDYSLVANIVSHIICTTEDGAILIFMPGWMEIKKTIEAIQYLLRPISDKLLVLPLHSLMPTINQREVFDHPSSGIRKIIVATNIAETSITIDDVVYVIDCGKIKMKNFDTVINLSTLDAQWVSRANAKQRAGRAGRVQAGVCYHLFTRLHETHLADYQLPEMLRTRLEELCLQIKLLKLGRIEEFVSKALEPPSLESIHLAIELLRNINALDADESLTPLGYHLAKMPVDPQMGKMLLFAALFSCLDPILTVAACLSFKDPFYVPMGMEGVVDARRKELSGGSNSDHIMLVNAFQGWEKARSRGGRGAAMQYCRHNFMSSSVLEMLEGMRKQFCKHLYDLRFLLDSSPKSGEANRNSDNINLVKAVICAGLYPNVAKQIGKRRKRGVPPKLRTKADHKVSIHPKSVNVVQTGPRSRFLVYHIMMKTSQIFVYDSTFVSPCPLIFFGQAVTCQKDMGQSCIAVDDWITVGASKRTASIFLELREELERLMTHKITHPGAICWKTKDEGDLMEAIIDLITTETDTDQND